MEDDIEMAKQPTLSPSSGAPAISEVITQQWRSARSDLQLDDFLLAIYFMRLGTLVDTAFDRRCRARYGIGGGDMRVLLALRRGGPPYARRPTDLFRALLVTSGAITKKVDRLVQAGLAERLPDPGHAGGFLVHLTKGGLRVVEETVEWLAVESVLGPATAQLSPKARQAFDAQVLGVLSVLETLHAREADACGE